MSSTPSEGPIDFLKYKAARAKSAGDEVRSAGGDTARDDSDPYGGKARAARLAGKFKLRAQSQSERAASGRAPVTARYKCGQNVPCRILAKKSDGYAILVLKNEVPGNLITTQDLQIGQEVLGVFACVYRGQIILSPLIPDA